MQNKLIYSDQILTPDSTDLLNPTNSNCKDDCLCKIKF